MKINKLNQGIFYLRSAKFCCNTSFYPLRLNHGFRVQIQCAFYTCQRLCQHFHRYYRDRVPEHDENSIRHDNKTYTRGKARPAKKWTRSPESFAWYWSHREEISEGK